MWDLLFSAFPEESLEDLFAENEERFFSFLSEGRKSILSIL